MVRVGPEISTPRRQANYAATSDKMRIRFVLGCYGYARVVLRIKYSVLRTPYVEI